MKLLMRSSITRPSLLIAPLLALFLTLLSPEIASAHAILLRSDPAKDAVLATAPGQVRMWFSEDLNPAFTTATVINASNSTASNVNASGHRVDNRDAHISPSDSKEMDVTLQPNLPPAAYLVLYQTDSAEDGHILRGSFLFYVARPDGSVPSYNGNALAGQNLLGGNTANGQFDSPTLVNLVVITLVELGAVFWVGAQLWFVFVLQPATQDHKEEYSINQHVIERFERRFSLPALLVLLLANIGVLVGQALNINTASALSPTVIASLATSGRFGTFWSMREIVIGVALLLSLYTLLFKRRPTSIDKVLPWINLLLGLALLIAISMSSHAAAVSKNLVLFAVPIDWLHLLAASVWIGGMMTIATTYLPVLSRTSLAERTRSLITTLPYYSPWALGAVALMAVTGPFNATFHLTSFAQLITTAYGRALIIKIVLVGALLLTSAIHVILLRPRLKKEYKKYAYAVQRVASHQADQAPTTSDQAIKSISQQVKLREGRMSSGTQRLTTILRWEPLLGVAVLICVGLMNVFAGTLSPITAGQQQQTTANAKPYTTSVKTTDNKFTINFNVTPDRFGTNMFTVSVIDNKTGKPATNIGVSLYTTMLDMDMGTDSVNLLPDGKGHFSASGDLSMGGNWQVRIQVRTPDSTLHEARVQFLVAF